MPKTQESAVFADGFKQGFTDAGYGIKLEVDLFGRLSRIYAMGYRRGVWAFGRKVWATWQQAYDAYKADEWQQYKKTFRDERFGPTEGRE